MSSEWRGCASSFPLPLSQNDERAAQSLTETVYYYNCRVGNPQLPDIEYRTSYRDEDVTRHVFRWDTTPYQQVFQNGFVARRQGGIEDDVYFNLDRYVHHGGRPLDSTRPTTHAFVSTTLSSSWRPPIPDGTQGNIQAYRYEIYAPGGIWVAETFGDQYRYPSQDEVCFVAGIAPQYIRAAQLFIGYLESGGRGRNYPRWVRADNRLIFNARFDPQSGVLLPIQRPINYCRENGELDIDYYVPPSSVVMRGKRQASNDGDDTVGWYARRVLDLPGYISAAFRSSRTNEAYIFMTNECALMNYAPGTNNDRIVNGPNLICDGFPSLIGTTFDEHGIDCAFDTDGDKAFIFSGKLCALIDYAPGTTNDKILSGPTTIAAMFPFFKDTVFKSGIDAAFRSTRSSEAYLFKGDQYALINYQSNYLIAIRYITDGFRSLKGTKFASGIDAAFASHRTNEAYLFKEDQYLLLNFSPGTTDDYIINGPKPTLPNWPSLRSILPRNNRGLDVHDRHNQPQADRDHDEL